MKKLTTRQIALNGVVAGLYAAITILTASFAYGNIQFRIADSLCVLVVLEPSLTVGLTLGCLISNIFSTVSALDIVIGTAGTLLGCLLAARVKKDWLVPVPVILANAVLVGAMLAYVLTPDALVQGFFINGGEVLLTNTCNAHLAEVLRILRRAGCMVSASGDSSVALASSGALRAAGGWDTGVYPSFPTDAAPLMAAALLRAQGESRVTDTIFENRFACAEGFLRLGASVNVCGRTLHVHGMDLLNGADVEAPDLRGGAALVIAALQAQGSTRVMGAEHISRGYEDIAALLAPLGARITRSWG